MRCVSAFSSAAALAVICGISVLPAPAQTFAAGVRTTPPPMIVADSGPGHVSVPGRRHHAGKELIFARVRDGVYSVDGMVAKVRLNYDIQGANYMYLFLPGVGTAVVSAAPDEDALMLPATLQAGALTFSADGHHFSLSGVSLASDQGQSAAHLYVRLDRSAWHLSRTPMIGFGDRAAVPYEWPGALPAEHAEESQSVPPIPASLLPSASAIAPTVPVPAAANLSGQRPSSLR